MKFLFPTIFIFIFSLSITAQEYLPELVKRIKPSAVAIETFDSRGASLSRGSGFFIAPDKIVTNRHVIEKAGLVEVHLINGKKYPIKGVLAIDGEGDLAILQVDVPPAIAVTLPIERAAPQEGESIVVVGNPFGLEGSVSNGIVSAVREIAGYGKIIQITAPISPGSSGSPVVNMRGQVIGVATLQAAEGQSLNFAVPSERIAQLKIGTLQTLAGLNAETQKNKRAVAQNFYSQGMAQLSLEDYVKAVVLFDKAAETDPNYAEAWYQSGYCYGMLGKHNEALKSSRRAALLRPEWAETFINVGASSFALGQFKEAADAYRQAAKLDTSNADAQFALGLSLNKINRPEEEILAYKRAVAIKPDHFGALEKLGAAYFKQRRFSDAVQIFETLKTYKPEAKTYNLLGEAYFELNKYENAIEAFNNSVNLKPDFEKARFNLGRSYLKKGDRDAANMQYELLRNSNSDWADRLFALLNP